MEVKHLLNMMNKNQNMLVGKDVEDKRSGQKKKSMFPVAGTHCILANKFVHSFFFK